jgi:hypothetical protein
MLAIIASKTPLRVGGLSNGIASVLHDEFVAHRVECTAFGFHKPHASVFASLRGQISLLRDSGEAHHSQRLLSLLSRISAMQRYPCSRSPIAEPSNGYLGVRPCTIVGGFYAEGVHPIELKSVAIRRDKLGIQPHSSGLSAAACRAIRRNTQRYSANSPPSKVPAS